MAFLMAGKTPKWPNSFHWRESPNGNGREFKQNPNHQFSMKLPLDRSTIFDKQLSRNALINEPPMPLLSNSKRRKRKIKYSHNIEAVRIGSKRNRLADDRPISKRKTFISSKTHTMHWNWYSFGLTTVPHTIKTMLVQCDWVNVSTKYSFLFVDCLFNYSSRTHNTIVCQIPVAYHRYAHCCQTFTTAWLFHEENFTQNPKQRKWKRKIKSK